MNQLTLTLEPPKARTRDPETSKAAAKRAERFQASHAGRVLEALRIHPMTAQEIADHTGLTVVQVCRRAVELQRAAQIDVLMQGGAPIERDGFRVWTISTPEKTKPAVDAAGL